ncbi:MAG: hypothetical protein PHO65_01095 [Sulfurovum sp.]|nr:hypothetical protein [Sulfurovum sp.]
MIYRIIRNVLSEANVDEKLINLILSDQKVFHDYDYEDEYDQMIINHKLTAILEVINSYDDLGMVTDDYGAILFRVSKILKSKY